MIGSDFCSAAIDRTMLLSDLGIPVSFGRNSGYAEPTYPHLSSAAPVSEYWQKKQNPPWLHSGTALTSYAGPDPYLHAC